MKHLLILSLVLSLVSPAFALETVEGAKKDFQAAKEEVALQLDALDKKIEELKASAKEKSTAAKQKTLKEAENTRTKLRADYEAMKANTASNWSTFKKKVAGSLDRLNKKAQKALNE